MWCLYCLIILCKTLVWNINIIGSTCFTKGNSNYNGNCNASFYRTFYGLLSNICDNLRIVWQKCLYCDLTTEEWLKILSNIRRHIKGKLNEVNS